MHSLFFILSFSFLFSQPIWSLTASYPMPLPGSWANHSKDEEDKLSDKFFRFYTGSKSEDVEIMESLKNEDLSFLLMDGFSAEKFQTFLETKKKDLKKQNQQRELERLQSGVYSKLLKKVTLLSLGLAMPSLGYLIFLFRPST